MTRQQMLAELPPADPTLLGDHDTDDEQEPETEPESTGNNGQREAAAGPATAVIVEGVDPAVITAEQKKHIRNFLIDYLAAQMRYPVSGVKFERHNAPR